VQLAAELQDMMQVGALSQETFCWVIRCVQCIGCAVLVCCAMLAGLVIWLAGQLHRPVLAGGPCCTAARVAAGCRAAGHDAGRRCVFLLDCDLRIMRPTVLRLTGW
jgi:hypothetical protein